MANLYNDELEDLQPTVTSSNPDVRKMARALRIQRRIEAIKKTHEPPTEEEIEAGKSKLEKQVVESAERLERLLCEGEELITNVGVGNDARETSRRQRRRELHLQLLARLDEEAALAAGAYADIDQRWAGLQLHNDPLDIHASIGEQQARCAQLIAQKDALVDELRAHVDRAEREFAAAQRSQRADAHALAERVDRQVRLMRDAYRHELRLVEAAVAAERAQAMDAAAGEWERMRARRDQLEHGNMLARGQQQESFLDDLHDNRVANEELFRDTKIALENENQVLQQELEHLRAFCLLNGERLDYNYQILRKREDENLVIKSQQKRLMNRLRDETARVRTAGEQWRARASAGAARLRAEIAKLRNSVFQVEAKAALLQRGNDDKYHQVWRHNERRASKLLAEILAADRCVSEQALGQRWAPPRWHRLAFEALPSRREAAARLADGDQEDVASSAAAADDDDGGGGGGGGSMPDSLRRAILSRIGDRSGFMLEEQLTEIVAEMRREHGDLVKVESVFEALGLTTQGDMRALMQRFEPYVYCELCESTGRCEGARASELQPQVPLLQLAGATETPCLRASASASATSLQLPDVLREVQQPPDVIDETVARELELGDVPSLDGEAGGPEEESGGEQQAAAELAAAVAESAAPPSASGRAGTFQPGHPLTVEPAYVHKALRDFVSRFNERRVRQLTIPERLRRRRLTVSRALSAEDVRAFWAQFAGVLSRDKRRLWDALALGLERYRAVLEDRRRINGDVLRLRRQNAELRRLLDTCGGGRPRAGSTAGASSSCPFSP